MTHYLDRTWTADGQRRLVRLALGRDRYLCVAGCSHCRGVLAIVCADGDGPTAVNPGSVSDAEWHAMVDWALEQGIVA